MTLAIKFSKIYPKLHNQKQAILLNVGRINYHTLSKELIEYDTKSEDGTYYELPKTELIHLTFLGDELIPFCTIRRFTDEKYQYYQKNINNIFQIEVKQGD